MFPVSKAYLKLRLPVSTRPGKVMGARTAYRRLGKGELQDVLDAEYGQNVCDDMGDAMFFDQNPKETA